MVGVVGSSPIAPTNIFLKQRHHVVPFLFLGSCLDGPVATRVNLGHCTGTGLYNVLHCNTYSVAMAAQSARNATQTIQRQ
ncbi:MAG: hypothetical protein RL081_77 [Pseudomonadota bacterium]